MAEHSFYGYINLFYCENIKKEFQKELFVFDAFFIFVKNDFFM
jgi:hypothetical protein